MKLYLIEHRLWGQQNGHKAVDVGACAVQKQQGLICEKQYPYIDPRHLFDTEQIVCDFLMYPDATPKLYLYMLKLDLGYFENSL